MPVTTTVHKGHASGFDPSLTISHTSDSNPLYVMLSYWVTGNTPDTTDRVSSVTFNGTALTQGGFAAVQGNTLEWWRLAAPAATTANVVITNTSNLRIAAAVMNLSGWPSAIADHLFVTDSDRQNVRHPSISITSSIGGEVIDWLGYNDPGQNTTPLESGQSEIYTLDGAHPGTLDQRQAGSLRSGLAGSTAMSWNMTTGGDWWGHGLLSFVVAANAVPLNYEDTPTIEPPRIRPDITHTIHIGADVVRLTMPRERREMPLVMR